MLDLQTNIHEYLNNFQDEDYEPRYQKDAAFRDLALWSNPAWLECTRCILPVTAATQWVIYNRISIEMNKVTIAQLIGSVKGVIPKSKLAEYGDYSYNREYEDMYLATETVTLKNDRYVDSIDSSHHNQSHKSIYDKEGEIKIIQRWLKKVKNALDGVRRITNEGELLDSGTSELLKLCSRFTYAASINDDLIGTLKSEISFTADYEELQKMPVRRIELQSIPQPKHDTLDSGAVDDLWLSLSSPEVQRCWRNVAAFPFGMENIQQSFNNPLVPLMKINFLRHQSKRERLEAHTVDIPKDVQRELLGSLLDVIEETPRTAKSGVPNGPDDGPGKLPAEQRAVDPGVKIQTTFVPIQNPKVDLQRTGSLSVPLFHKSVPPPSLAWAMRGVRPPPYDVQCLFPKRSPVLRPNYVRPLAQQQVQFNIPPPASSPNWNAYFNHHVMNASLQYPRLTVPALNPHRGSNEVAELPKRHPKSDGTALDSGKNFQQGDVPVKDGRANVENRPRDFNLWPKNKALAQPPPHHDPDSKLRVHRSCGNLSRNYNSLSQPALCDMRHTAPNLCGAKSNVQLQAREYAMPLVKTNRSLMGYTLCPRVIQSAISTGGQGMAQVVLQSRFTGTSIRQMQDRTILERWKASETPRMPHQDTRKSVPGENLPLVVRNASLSYEDKVEKWLEAVNKYMKPNHFVKFDEFADACRFEASNGGGKWDVRRKEIAGRTNWHGKRSTRRAGHGSEGSEVSGKLRDPDGNPAGPSKCGRRIARELLSRHSQLLKKSAVKLRKGKDLEGKIKFLKRYFAEVDTLRSRPRMKNPKSAKRTPVSKGVPESRKCAESAIEREKTGPESRAEKGDSSSSGGLFDAYEGISLVHGYKVLVHESPEFNAFPSKRTKVTNSLFSSVIGDLGPREEQARRVASLRYFDRVIDELFFSSDVPGDINERTENKSTNLEVMSGWTHFKVTVKSVLKTIISSMDR